MTASPTLENLNNPMPDAEQMIGRGDIFAPGQIADHEFGVAYQGPWETLEDGTCRAVRLHARALANTGVPVLLRSYNHTRIVDGVARYVFDYGHDPNVLSEVGTLHRSSIASTCLFVRHLVVKSADHVLAALYPRGVIGSDESDTRKLYSMLAACTILYTVWERDCIPKDIARVMSMAAQCWVPCQQNKQALIASGVPKEKVFVVPHPYTTEEWQLAQEPSTSHKSSFYSIGAWQPRKGMHELLGAFLLAFRADGDETLRLRTTEYQWDNYPSPRESIKQWLEDPAVRANGWTVATLKGKVEVFPRYLTQSELHNFHRNNRIYVCASHGEAWCLPAFDAKLHGNLLVHVPWGGTADFAAQSDIRVPYSMEPVNIQHSWGDCQWAGYSILDLMAALRIATKTQSGCRLGSEYQEQCIGEYMKRLLMKVSSAINTPEAQHAMFGGPT